jgi:XRE family transcriptional regulator, aerobic/anaerobic benzoate catabolism transcriptional regulator
MQTLTRQTEASLQSEAFSAPDAEFLATVANRVRTLREQRGMTRRALAKESGVSERYLGQLEAGQANASILLLRRISAALCASLPDLLFQEALGKKRVALVGLRGAGKTTLGSLLAKRLGVPFVEVTQEIRRDSGLPVGEIIALYGQAGYRRIERKTLERVIAQFERAIVAAGGGIVSEEETFNLLRANCYTVWLRSTPDEHMARVLEQGDFRPMSGNAEAMADLKRILAAREPLYRKCHATVDTAGDTPGQSLEKLVEAVSV